MCMKPQKQQKNIIHSDIRNILNPVSILFWTRIVTLHMATYSRTSWVVKVGDFVIIKEEYILYKGNPFEHVFIFLSINVS